MKIWIKDLLRINDEKIITIDISSLIVKDNIYLRRIENIIGEIEFYYDYENKLRINYQICGTMICPCAISLEDTPVNFDLSDDDKICFKENENGFFLIDGISVEDLVCFIVIPEVPIKVVKNKKIEYSRGDGWSFVSEDDYELHKKNDIDPRLQKLRDFKFEEDD